MRLLHTSDWHLGRTLHGVNLHEAQSGLYRVQRTPRFELSLIHI